ncbi:MAG: hypothetical protein IT513_12515 [Burkholderiales bacterium]|nr:hypothetical protein [Burkholderiales bacterium]
MTRTGFCRTCEKPTDESAAVCPHCGQEAPFDRYEDLALGQTYAADFRGDASEDMHWFRLRSSGRSVFARIAHGEAAWEIFRQVQARNGEHRLELVSFSGGYPNFRYRS